MAGGGAFVAFLALAEQLQLAVAHRSPLATGILFWPQVLGAILAAWLLGALLRTRLLPALVLAGMLALVAAGALLLGLEPRGSQTTMLAAAGLLGLGAGATVAPALWLAAMSLPVQMVGRTFALVELVRSEADFILAPVVVEVAALASAGETLTAHGIRQAMWVTLWITVGSGALALAVYLGGRGRPRRPALEDWLEDDATAVDSPALGAAFRRGR